MNPDWYVPDRLQSWYRVCASRELPPGKVIGPNELWAGSPAKLRRVMDEAEQARFARNAVVYRKLAARFRAGLRSAQQPRDSITEAKGRRD